MGVMAPERIDPHVPGQVSKSIKLEHLARYQKALSFCDKGSRVLDAGCGLGYGSDMLAQRAVRVDGVDNDDLAIKYASEIYSEANKTKKEQTTHKFAKFHLADLETADLTILGPKDYELVTCFEVIEHLKDPAAALKNIRAAMGKKAYLLLSTPNSAQSNGDNQFHVRGYSRKELGDLLTANGFKINSIKNQGFSLKELSSVIRGIAGKTPQNIDGTEQIPLKEYVPGAPQLFAKIYNGMFFPSRAIYFFVIAQPKD